MFCLTALDVFWQLATAIGFQFLYHIRTDLGNQAEDMFGCEGFKTLSIHSMTYSHITGKAQQTFINFLWV